MVRAIVVEAQETNSCVFTYGVCCWKVPSIDENELSAPWDNRDQHCHQQLYADSQQLELRHCTMNDSNELNIAFDGRSHRVLVAAAAAMPLRSDCDGTHSGSSSESISLSLGRLRFDVEEQQ